MRKGLTLLELIFTMVIVAITFVVIPKIMLTYSTVAKTVVKEDAIYNTITMMGLITHLAWDERNLNSDSILSVTDVNSTLFTCDRNTTGYRRGGFVGGRNCIVNAGVNINANSIPSTPPATLNSIGSYNGYDLDTQTPCHGKLYDLGVKVSYAGGSTSNIKHIEITTQYDSAFKVKNDGCVMFDYYSYNIGQVGINKRRWE